MKEDNAMKYIHDLPSEIFVNNGGRLSFYEVLTPNKHIIIDAKLSKVELNNGDVYQLVRDILGKTWAVFIG